MPLFKQGMRAGRPFYGLEIGTRALPCFSELYDILCKQSKSSSGEYL